MGVAEVTLSFTGASESLPVEYDEISITRRVTRAGGSEYFLNRQPYRLHEIRDLLAGTGLGNHVYSIIELGMVKDILAETGDKRRLLFEEASGVMRYKLRRKESLAKLTATEGYLTRLADILDELSTASFFPEHRRVVVVRDLQELTCKPTKEAEPLIGIRIIASLFSL